MQKEKELTNREMRKLAGLPDMSDFNLKRIQTKRSWKEKIDNFLFVASWLLGSCVLYHRRKWQKPK